MFLPTPFLSLGFHNNNNASKPTDNTIDQNSIEYDDIDPSVEIDVDEIMKQKTDNDFDDKV